jgi:site-specific recombinase XerD
VLLTVLYDSGARSQELADLLTVLYDSGARAQELADLTIQDVRLQTPAQLRLTGKG